MDAPGGPGAARAPDVGQGRHHAVCGAVRQPPLKEIMLNVLQWIVSLLLFRRRDRIRCGMAYRNAQARLRRGDRAGAERLFEAALACGVTDARPYVQYAIALIDGGETARAVDLLDNAAEVEPDNPVPQLYLGIALSEAGRQKEAMAELERAVQRAPGNLLARSALSLARMRTGNARDAARELLAQGIADSLDMRTRLLIETERRLSQGAVGLPDQLLPLQAKDDDPPAEVPANIGGARCFKLATRAMQHGRYNNARALLHAAIDRGADSDELRLHLAGVELGVGKHTEAADKLLEIPETSTVRGPALFYAAVARYLAGEPEVALELLDKAEATHSVYEFQEIICYYRGRCLLATGADDRCAREVLANALDADWTLLPRRLAMLAEIPAS